MNRIDSSMSDAEPAGKSGRWRTAVIRLIDPPGWQGDDGLELWRERILRGLLGSGLLMTLVALPLSLVAIVHAGRWGLMTANLCAAVAAWGLLQDQRLSYRFRAVCTLLVCYSVGAAVILNFGPLSGGPAWLFCFAVLAGVLLGVRAAGWALVINGLSVVTLGAMAACGYCGPEMIYFDTTARALAAGVNFLFLNAVSAISVAVLVSGLFVLSRKEKQALAALKAERADLIAARESLKAEVTERVRAERSLRESEERYRFLTENIDDVIWTMDLEMNYTYISPAVDRLQGWSPKVVMAMSLDQVLPPASLKKAMEILAEYLSQGKATDDFSRRGTFEAELYRSDGSTVPVEITALFMVDDDRQPVGILGVTRNITERLKAQQEKETLRDQLARAKKMEALGLLAGGVAHDLNNILSGVLSYPELLLMDLPQDSRFRKPLETIRDSGRRAAAVVSDLITVARGVASQRDPIDVNDLVERFMNGPEFRELKRRHDSVAIQTDPGDGLLYMEGSAVHLEKVLMNLVNNAMEAVEGQGTVVVRTRNRYLDEPMAGSPDAAKGEYVVLSVADDGPGISQEDRERIFEPFYTRKIMGRSGTGLGLTVVWNTVQDHGGFIAVRTGDGGTTFDLYFPATRQSPVSLLEEPSIDGLMGNGELILVVDDEASQREIASGMLHRLGYRTHAVDGGEQALSYIGQNRVDLMLLDMMMPPGINGRETYQAVAAIRPGQKAILASGYAETEDVRIAQELGAGKYLRKPYGLFHLAMAIKEELGR